MLIRLAYAVRRNQSTSDLKVIWSLHESEQSAGSTATGHQHRMHRLEGAVPWGAGPRWHPGFPSEKRAVRWRREATKRDAVGLGPARAVQHQPVIVDRRTGGQRTLPGPNSPRPGSSASPTNTAPAPTRSSQRCDHRPLGRLKPLMTEKSKATKQNPVNIHHQLSPCGLKLTVHP